VNPITLTIPMRAIPKPRDGRYQWGRGMASKRRYFEWRDAFRIHAVSQGRGKPVTGGVRVWIYFYMTKTRRADIDNLIGSTLDALTGILYLDDLQVIQVSAETHDKQSHDVIQITMEPA
jgi:Holliday junction resolvase RusA-like endonuclease